jgi:hypothetical protein
MRLNKKVLASMTAIGFAAGGLFIQSAGAGAQTTVGNSKAKVVVSGKTYKMSGGACVVSSSHLDIGIGSNGNTIGINAAVKNGKFKNAQIGMVLGHQPVAITTDTGKVTSKGGSFSGTDVVSNSTVKGTFTC